MINGWSSVPTIPAIHENCAVQIEHLNAVIYGLTTKCMRRSSAGARGLRRGVVSGKCKGQGENDLYSLFGLYTL